MSAFPYPRNTALTGLPFLLLDGNGAPIAGVPTGGTWTLSINGETTGALGYNAAASDVQAALEALTLPGSGNVACSGGPWPLSSITATFAVALGNLDPMTAANNLIGGSNPTIDIATSREGAAATSDVQHVGISFPDEMMKAGHIHLSADGQAWTGELYYHAAASEVQSALEALSAIGQGNIVVTGGMSDWTCTFAVPRPRMTLDASGLYYDGTAVVDLMPGGGSAAQSEIQAIAIGHDRPDGYLTQDGGPSVSLTNQAYALGHGQWAVDLTAEETNAAILGVLLVQTDARPTSILVATTAEPVNFTALAINSSGVVRANDAGGNALATSSEVVAIQNNTRAVRVVPSVMERPDSGSIAYRIELLLHDSVGGMESPDAAPTVDVVDQSGISRNGNLSGAQMTLITTGRYRATYTVSATHELEQLVFAFSVVENGATRQYANTALIVDTTAADFTAADRAKLEAIHGKLPSIAYLRGTNQEDGGLSPTDLADIDGLLVDPDNASVAAIKAKTDLLPAQPAAEGSLMTLSSAERAAIADAVLSRSASSVEATAGDHSLCYVILAMSEANTTAHAGKLTVFRTDGVTEFARKALTSLSGAAPITGVS